MGKNNTPAPTPPDPRETAAAQTGSNVSTGIANQLIGMVDQVGPNGSMTYDQTGSSSFTDPSTGQTYEIPRFTQTTALSDDQQALYDQNNATSLALGSFAGNQVDRLAGHLSSPFSLDGLPDRGSIPGAGNVQTGYETQGLQRNNLSGPSFGNLNGNAGLSTFGGNAPSYQTLNGGTPAYDEVTGNAPSYANVGAGPQYQTSYIDDFSEDRQRVEDALNSRLDRQQARDRSTQDARLADQGIKIGSDAYTRATADQQQGFDEGRISAMLASGQEQSRLAGLSRDQAMFGNDARSRGFNDRLNATSLNNQYASQGFRDNLDRTRLNNQFRSQGFNDSLNQASFNNSAASQGFRDRFDIANFDNSIRQQSLDNQNSATAQNNQYAQVGYQNEVDRINSNNNATQYENMDAAAQAAFNNQAVDQSQNYGYRTAAMQDAQRQQAIQEQLTARNQPLNEVSALMSGSQVSMPQFSSTPGGNIAGTNYAGIVQDGYQNQMNAYNQQQANNRSLLGGIFGLGSSLALSDERAKEVIKPLAKLKNGLTVYLYRYLGGVSEHIGLLAQDVEKIRPEAIVKLANGFKAVDYERACA